MLKDVEMVESCGEPCRLHLDIVISNFWTSLDIIWVEFRYVQFISSPRVSAHAMFFFSRGFADYENWRNAWNEAKANYCCEKAGRGCPQTPQLPGETE